jgi:hypothetical protein
MSNTFLTPEIVAKEALMVLTGNLVMADLVHRDFSEDFVSVGDTVTVRKPAKFVAKNFTGQTESQDVTEESISVKLDRFRDVTVAVTSKELSLDIADFSRQVVEPAMQAIAQAIDQDLLAVAVSQAGFQMTSDPEAASLKDIAALAKHLDLKKAPTQNRSLVLSPEHKYRYALAENLSSASYTGDNQMLRDAMLGRLYTLETYMDQCTPDSNAKKPGTAVSFNLTGTAGNTYVNVSEVDGTIMPGDGFILDGYLYHFAQGGTGRLNLDQPLMTSCSGVAAIPVNKPTSVAFHRNGIALVTRNLALPMGASNAAYASAGGLGVRVVYDYDAATKTDKISFDVIYGIKTLDPDLICSMVG